MTAQPIPDAIPPVLGPGQPLYDRWKDESDFFERERQRLYADDALRSKYVAIYRRQIIGIHNDQFELGRQMRQLHPHEVVLIVKVELEDRPIEFPGMEMRH